jgi:hypothetical protein
MKKFADKNETAKNIKYLDTLVLLYFIRSNKSKSILGKLIKEKTGFWRRNLLMDLTALLVKLILDNSKIIINISHGTNTQ